MGTAFFFCIKQFAGLRGPTNASMRRFGSSLLGFLFLILVMPAFLFFTFAIYFSKGSPVLTRARIDGFNYEHLQFKAKKGSWLAEFIDRWMITYWTAMWDVATGRIDAIALLRICGKRRE